MATKIEEERRKRIKVALCAIAYEKFSDSLISDAAYDALSLEIDPSIETGHAVLDKFFKEGFAPYTGSWVYDHPEYDKLVALYMRLEMNGTLTKMRETLCRTS